MMNGRRIAIIIVVAVLLAVGVAMIVFGGPDHPGATSLGVSGGGGDLPAVAATDAASPGTETTDEVLDPAKQEPVLDLFVAKDPFVPLGGGTPTIEPTATPTATPTSTPTPNPVNADISIDGKAYKVAAGDETPSADPAFYVSGMTASAVTFELAVGGAFEEGSRWGAGAEGQTVMGTNADTGESYELKVVSLNYTADDGKDNEPAKNGHSIELLSINTRNGVDTATFKVDGSTYADDEGGAEFATDWGEIKVLAIDAGGQTVTILHGDDTIVLHVGQIVEK